MIIFKKNLVRRGLSWVTLLLFPLVSFGQVPIPTKVLSLMGKIYTTILNPIIVFLFAAAFLYFMYGVLRMVWYGDSEGEREKGRQSILWGIIGMFIMFSVFAIIRIVVNSFGGDLGDALNSV